MKVAFCSVSGADDRYYWSGTPYFMARHLKATLPDLVSIGPLQLFSQPFKEKHTLYTKMLRETYLWELEPLLHRHLSAEVERHLRAIGDVDLIFSPACFPYPNAFLDTKIPVVFWGDATFSGLLSTHPGYRSLCAENIWCGEQLQRQILHRSARALFASTWATNSACNTYDVRPEIVDTIPFGANLHFTIHDESQLEQVLSQRKAEACRLLLVARQWTEKGGDFAVAVLNAVHAAGLKATLTVIGCQLPVELTTNLRGDIQSHHAISKDAGTSEQAYADLLASSHFLLHPSLGDCFGIAMCEANAWAVPALARDSGGVGSLITNGKNGFILPAEADAQEYAQKIVELFSNYQSYLDLCRTAWQEYKTRLNWTTSAQLIGEILREIRYESRS